MPETSDTPLTTLADAAFRQAAAQVVRRAQQTGTPLIVWEQDRLQSIMPEENEPRKDTEGRPLKVKGSL